ncbi:uncharacterized protein E5676_scaffold216G001590 [Cucumis melo var. makuwa]|uniref:Retrovirus-related Pol polyprotein from transposon TNT 1-94-like beta-barrel domain-containing protein n=1 Tax=Cucumis melo var. makuwa TaxID=1194695 RepID=A0A5D3E3L7_CUCMM|nr:uncharacterized protein E6C27_scaffold280G003560 [Cucumis melo var. makuwa]TYK30171.1 uncharacterized protein E5676_scaffold216G001590 [Cucumis melo var. makuwa]
MEDNGTPNFEKLQVRGTSNGLDTLPLKFLSSVAGESTETVGVEASSVVSEGTVASSSTSMNSKIVNPKYEQWVTSDMLLLGLIYNSMVPDVALQLMGFNTAKDLWEAIQNLFGIKSRAEEYFLRHTFQTTREGNYKMEDYLRIMKINADNLGQAGSPVPHRYLISQVLLGLDEVYNPVTAVIQGKPDISWLDMQSELLIFENLVEIVLIKMESETILMAADVVEEENRGFNPNQNGKQIPDDAFITTQKSSSLATPETVVDTNRYVDSGATNHVTSDHSNLWNIDDYSGNENVVVGNENKLQISCVGYASLTDGKNCLRLDKILCVPEIKKNLAKDTGRVLLKGTLCDGLYHLEGVAMKSIGELEHSDSSKKST